MIGSHWNVLKWQSQYQNNWDNNRCAF
jgi:hypothetical protein